MIIGSGNKGEKVAEKIGDGDNAVAFVGANKTSFATGVGNSRDTREMREASKGEGADDDGGTGAATDSNDTNTFRHLLSWAIVSEDGGTNTKIQITNIK